MAVDGLHLGQYEDFTFIVAQLVVLHGDGFLLAFQHQFLGREQGLHQFASLVVINVEGTFLKTAIGGTVFHGVHATDAFRREGRTFIEVLKGEVFLFLRIGEEGSHQKEQDKEQ